MTAPISGIVLLAESTVLPEPRTGNVDALLTVVGHAVDGGVRAVIVRDKHRPDAARRALVDAVRDLLDPVDGTVLIAHDDPEADRLGADGVHLSATALHAGCPTPSVPAGRWMGWSTHNAGEVARAAAHGADYVTVSPVYPTASKPGYGPALGPTGVAELIAASPVPVLALGGISTPAHVAECLATGAVGVAVMGAILRSTDPGSTVSALVHQSSRCQKSSIADASSQRISGQGS